jgi:hypothetical protein
MFDLAGKFPHLRNPTEERERGEGESECGFFFCVESDQKRKIFQLQFVLCFVYVLEF